MKKKHFLTTVVLLTLTLPAFTEEKMSGRQYGCFHADVIFAYTNGSQLCPPFHNMVENPSASAHPAHLNNKSSLKEKERKKAINGKDLIQSKPIRHDPDTCPITIRHLGDN